MKKNLIVIFTFKYPFEPPTEQFLDDELHFLAEEDADILLVPSAREKKDALYPFPGAMANVSVRAIGRGSLPCETCAGLLSAAVHIRHLRNDVRRIFRSEQLHGKMRVLKETLKEHIQAGALYRHFVRQIPDQVFRGRERIILYSYWLNPSAAAEAMFKKHLKKRYAVPVAAYARAHGDGDLYRKGMEHCRPCLTLLNEEIDMIFPISRDGRESLMKDGILRAETRRLGVKKLSAFLPARNPVPLIVSCSVINANKRVEKIAEILAHIPRELRWIHFGGGEMEQSLRGFCEKRLPGNVHWEMRGWTPHDEIVAFYGKETPDLFLNVSRMEGIPVSVMEAMSYSIPCAATGVGASGEIVSDGRNGFLLPADFDVEETARKLEGYLSAAPEKKNRMRKHAYETFEQEYDSAVNYAAFARRMLSAEETPGGKTPRKP
jgi:glycosyltransferase involved in cell wall biosynthesis